MDRSVKIWDTSQPEGDCKCIKTLLGHKGEIFGLAFHPSATSLASCSADRTAKIWDLVTGKCTMTLPETESGDCTMTLSGHVSGVMSVAYGHEGELLLTGSADNLVKVWNLRPGKQCGKCIATLEGHGGQVVGIAASWGETSNDIICTASADMTVRVWELPGADVASESHTDYVKAVAWSPCGKMLATGVDDACVKIWDFGDDNDVVGGCKATLQGPHGRGVIAVAFSLGGKFLAAADQGRVVRLYDLSKVGPQEGGLDEGSWKESTRVLRGHEGSVTAVAFDPTDSCGATGTIATASKDKTVRIWSLSTMECTAVLAGHDGGVTSVAFNPPGAPSSLKEEGRMLASGSEDCSAKLWVGELCKATLRGHRGPVLLIAISGDGLLLASASADKTARVWSLTDGSCIADLFGHTDIVRGVVFLGSSTSSSSSSSTSGWHLATSSSDCTVRTWDATYVESGKCLAELRGHSEAVSGIAYSVESSALASVSDDKTLRVWRMSHI